MCNFSTNKVINDSAVKFGTSGARGLVVDFTASVTQAYVINFISVLQKKEAVKTVAIAIDNRPSSYAIALDCVNALISVGVDYNFYGVVPTPALANYAFQNNIPAIMVTGSHIPFDRNGLKFYTSKGEITKTEELEITSCDNTFKVKESITELKINSEARDSYIKRYTEFFPKDCLHSMRIGIYEHSSAGRDLYRKIFEDLGATVISLGRTQGFVSIDTEAVSEDDKQRAKAWRKEYKLDALFSTDGDGDRPLLTDEHGEWLRGDILCILCAIALKIDAVATPISSNSLVSLCQKFSKVLFTKIGSPYVIDGLMDLQQKYNSVAGFEANGGFILVSEIHGDHTSLPALPTRDSVLPALVVLANYGRSGISDAINALPQRFTYSDRIQNFPADISKKLIEMGQRDPHKLMNILDISLGMVNRDYTDGVRLTLVDSSIIQIRSSVNTPELRIYSESSSQEKSMYYVFSCM